VCVQRLQQLPRLRRVGVIDHVRIITSIPTNRAPGTGQRTALYDVELAHRGRQAALVLATVAS
jgi:hypothetical protein